MSEGAELTRPRRVLLVGGSTRYRGGLEIFCERATDAMRRESDWVVDRLPSNTAHLRPASLPAYLRSLGALLRHRRDRPDVVWVQYGNLLDLTCVVVAKLAGMRVLLTPHIGTGWRSQQVGLLRLAGRMMMRAADRLALISPTQEVDLDLPPLVPRSLIRTFLPAEVLAGVEAEASALPPEVRLVHAGRLSEGKGSFLFVDTCAGLRDAGVAFSAEIIGAGDDDATVGRLRDAIAAYGLERQVALVGPLPVSELVARLRRSDVLVHLSRVDSYPLIVLEALAGAALPVVLDLAGARAMVERYGGAIVSDDAPAQEAADWLGKLDLSALRRERGALAARTRSDFSWPQCAAILQETLEECARA